MKIQERLPLKANRQSRTKYVISVSLSSAVTEKDDERHDTTWKDPPEAAFDARDPFDALKASVRLVGNDIEERTLRSTLSSGMSNSPIMQRGMAPPQGLALSILRSKRTVSIPFSWAKISAAQAPAGPPPTTATLYFIQRELEDVGTPATDFPAKEEAVKAEEEATSAERVTRVNFIFELP